LECIVADIGQTPAELAPLFEPITLGNVEIRNRIVMAGHSTGLAEGYKPSERHVAYYRERSMGGAGLIGMAFPVIHPSSQEHGEPRAFDPAIVPGLARISEGVHEYGARIVMQLGHGGREGSSVLTERALWAPSSVPCPFNLEMPKEMERQDIDDIVEAHAIGARHAISGGMDGVEIHSGYGGYLLASFLSGFSNFRNDEYGGSLENRMRILLRVIQAVRAEVGHDCLLGVNLQGHDFSPHGLTVEDAQAIAQAIEAGGGVDYLYVKAATYLEANQNVPDMQHPKLIWASLAAAVKRAVDIPVIAVGRIVEPAEAASVLRNDQADLVAMTRQQIADPETVNKMREGRLDDIRRCIGCNQGCIDRLFQGSTASCVHNPAAGYELELGIGTLKRTRDRKRVVVVGGGPAGLKSAEVAARAGHDVVLLERRPHVGGQLRMAAAVDGREEIGGVISYLQTQVGKLGVDVRLSYRASAGDVAALEPDRVIVATGSAPPIGTIIGNLARGHHHIAGLEHEHVLNVWDVLEGGVAVGATVLVADDGEGSWKSISLAFHLAARGHDVHLSTPLPYVGAKIGPFSRNRLIPRLFESAITEHVFTSVASVQDGAVTLSKRGREDRLDGIDTIVLAGWHAPVADVYFDLQEAGTHVERVGDAIACRSMLEAVHEGERAARRI
jgi:2,4-dienoyl-CoA reductase-like NADH-dependent reductase (Old Yellow Enzyme family)